MLSTGNYRGHIATYEIVNNELFLIKIIIPEHPITFEKSIPEKTLNFKNYFPNKLINNGKVKTIWFNGIIMFSCYPYKEYSKTPYGTDCYYINYKKFCFIDVINGSVTKLIEINPNKYYEIVDQFEKGKLINIDSNNKLIIKWLEFIKDNNKRINSETEVN